MGLRTSVVRNGVTSNYIFRGREVSHELDEENNVKNREVRGYRLLNKDTSNQSLESKVYYYLHNEHSDVTSLVDEDNKVKNSYEYDVFGDLIKSEEEVNNEFKYYEQQWDNETHLLYLRARYYNPTVGRFTQEDIYRGDGLNLYAYVKNNPVMWVDPSGYLTQRELAATVAGMTDEEVRNALNIRYEEYMEMKKMNVVKSSQELLPNELEIGTYDELRNLGEPYDDITPHHMPAASSVVNIHSGDYKDGLSMFVAGDTHTYTFTYGMGNNDSRAYDYALYNRLPYGEQVDFDIKNIEDAYAMQRTNVNANDVKAATNKYKQQSKKIEEGLTQNIKHPGKGL